MIDYSPAYEFVQDVTGLVFPKSRLTTITQVFADAMAHNNMTNPIELVGRMQTDAALRDAVVAKLTIGETYFFRDPAQFGVVRETILPDIMTAKHASSPIRMWSAACASGEEAYTLAILLEEQGLSARGDVTATDIARPRLLSAQLGRFKKWSLRGVHDTTIQRYFTREKDTFVLVPRLRERVSFKYLNLAEDTYPSIGLGIFDMDLIMCRNVLIYFDEATIARVAQRLVDSLSRTGWLLIGASDPPISQLIECDVVTTAAGLAYRRPGAGGKTAVRARPITSVSVQASPDAFDGQTNAVVEWNIPAEFAPPIEALATAVPDATATPAPDGDTLGGAVRCIRALCNTGDTREAADAAVHALETHADAPELHYLLAVALSHENENAEAVGAAKRALYFDRRLVIAHVLLGQLYTRLNDRDAAIRSFRNAADLLATEDAATPIAATDGERAGRIREIVAMQLKLLKAA